MSILSDITFTTNNLNIDLRNTIFDLGKTNSNLTINSSQISNVSLSLEDAKQSYKTYIKYYEKDEQRFKALQKLGHALERVEQLLQIMPTNLEHLSVSELEEKLQELLNTRTKNNDQMHFIFYQTMITDLLTNLMNIEKDYQAGKITSTDAYKSVQEAKAQIKLNYKEMPDALRPTLEEASFLVRQYEESYAISDTKNPSKNKSSIIETELSLKQTELLNNLNGKTEEIMRDVSSISANLNNFQPQVDISSLSSLLVVPKNIYQFENWDVDELSKSVSDIDTTASNLINAQTQKNNEAESLHTSIESCAKKTSELSYTSTKNFATEAFKNVTLRAKKNTQVISEVEEILESEDAMFTSQGSQIAETILTQADADERFIAPILSTANVDCSAYGKAEFDTQKTAALNLSEDILTKEEERILKIITNNEEDENPKT